MEMYSVTKGLLELHIPQERQNKCYIYKESCNLGLQFSNFIVLLLTPQSTPNISSAAAEVTKSDMYPYRKGNK